MIDPPFANDAVAAAFDRFPPLAREGTLVLRNLIFEIAAELPDVGTIDEDLRWGQPAYLTPRTKAGTTLRLGLAKGGGFGLFVHCQTRVISDFDAMFPGTDRVDGNRGVLFNEPAEIDPARHGLLIRSALTYHLPVNVGGASG